MSYDVTLGRLRFPTVTGDVSEAVGDALENVGAQVLAGERKPRPFTITLPIHGDALTDPDTYAAGARLRRQVRALIENTPARMQGLWFTAAFDADLDMVLLVGGGDLAYAEGGVALQDFELKLTDCYKIASLRTHREGRRNATADRRLSTTPRDTRLSVYSTDFASEPSGVLEFLPPGATDVVIGSDPIVANTRPMADGTPLPFLVGRPPDEVCSFTRPTSMRGQGDVVILDRQGSTSEADWEEVYGPDQPLTPGDVPVLDNGICRVQWIAEQLAFAVEAYLVEQGRVAFALPGDTEMGDVRIVEWTPERAVLSVPFAFSAGQSRMEALLSLQRGWTGPRVEVYQPGTPNIYWVPNTAGNVTVRRSNASYDSSAGGWNGTARGAWTGLEPWAALTRADNGRCIHFAVLQVAATLTTAVTTEGYGSNRNGFYITAPDAAGYLSVTIGAGAGAAFELTRTTDRLGVQNLAWSNLFDTRSVPILLAR